MFSIDRMMRNCQGLSRRAFLQVGSLPLLGLSLPRLLEARATGSAKKDINCILLWTNGGMSNIDTFDMKPEAPVEFRGEFQQISSNIPEMPVCEHLPRMARVMDKVCLVKSIAHTMSGDHAAATHYMLTGYPQRPDPTGEPSGVVVFPSFGSVVGHEKGWKQAIPPNIVLGGKLLYSGAGYLGSAFDPLWIRADPNAKNFQIRDVSVAESLQKRMQRRQQMLKRLDTWQRQKELSGAVAEKGEFYRQAFDLITSSAAKKAFKLDEEPAKLRDRYGRTRGGQGALLARRLIESGVRFVTVNLDGWDTHDKNFIELKSPLLPTLDQAWSALLEDLETRGLLDSTLVICAGEFGRTPKVNGAAGRDHYAPCNVVGLSGAGTAMGSVIGRTNSRCEHVVGQTNDTLDYAATIFRILGIDGSKEYHTEDGRPVFLNNGGKPIKGVIA
ncbi:DUF1501 domain-containing protein [Gimesia aquarii]|uniref:DUF1501 domain-containing protein n=1 Tax=Gimesia aquarii TaxID=2527964 RepID=A0A517WWM4_9PLAN|nr:DUF1501 domain-containing protein [Gimesia aquarii]QDU09671.1 hypothetical protein V202x_30470 [Gimesia aquarii]